LPDDCNGKNFPSYGQSALERLTVEARLFIEFTNTIISRLGSSSDLKPIQKAATKEKVKETSRILARMAERGYSHFFHELNNAAKARGHRVTKMKPQTPIFPNST
jgi:diphthamide synthase subunit DPH2